MNLVNIRTMGTQNMNPQRADEEEEHGHADVKLR